MVSINTTLRAFCRLVDAGSAVTGQGTWRGKIVQRAELGRESS
jgi:hypothetical protein